MTVFCNPEVEREEVVLVDDSSKFWEKAMRAPVTFTVPESNIADSDKGYIVHYLSRHQCLLPKPGEFGPDIKTVSLFMKAIHASFSDHIPFHLSPESVWFIIAHEVAIHIRQNRDKYRGYFTASHKQETIHVRDDSLRYGEPNDWARSINLIRDPLRQRVPQATIDLLLPQFSTGTEESSTALLVLFLNMVSNYYGLMWHTLCGIPEVKIDGTAEDWNTIATHIEMIQREFPPLHNYCRDLLPVVQEIRDTVITGTPDIQFWKSIYKYNGGSGGPYINGWITAFLAHRTTPEGFELRQDLNWQKNTKSSFSGLTADDLPVHLSVVPFKWDYYGEMRNMAFLSGFLGINHDRYLTPRLGFGVLEDLRPQD